MRGGSKYVPSRDGALCRVSGAWAQEKLYYVARYMEIFNKAMFRKWERRIYLDLLAGTGRCVLETGEEFAGSPILGVETCPAFTKVIAVDRAGPLIDALRVRMKGRAEIVEGDCNDSAVIVQLRALLDPSALSLCFVDMLGLEVAFETIRQLTDGLRMDLLITFQVNDLTRNMPGSIRRGGARLTRFFGTDGWLEVVRSQESGLLESADVASALTDFYCARLSTIGYQHVAQLHRLMRNSTNAPLYRLVLAARHERAAEFFRKISRIEFSGQRTLLGM